MAVVGYLIKKSSEWLKLILFRAGGAFESAPPPPQPLAKMLNNFSDFS